MSLRIPAMGGQVGANVQKVFAYGVRNGFGMAFDPESGALWDAQNGDDSFSELNRVDPGANLGWVNLKRWRTWPLLGVFIAAGLISFRGVFSELANKKIRPVRRK